MAESVYVPSTLKEGYFADLPAPVAGDDARPITYNHATLSFVYSSAFATAAQLTTHANLTNGAHGISAFGAQLVDDTTQGAAQSTLGLVIGTNIQAYNANLAAMAGLTGAADKLGYFTGVGAMALATFTAKGREVAAAADAAAIRTAAALGTIATAASGDYLLVTGATPGGTTTRQSFANGLTLTGGIRPASDTTTALQAQNAAGNAVAIWDTVSPLYRVQNPAQANQFFSFNFASNAATINFGSGTASAQTGFLTLDSSGNVVFRQAQGSMYWDYRSTLNFRAGALNDNVLAVQTDGRAVHTVFDIATTQNTDVLTMSHQSTGTPAANFAASFLVQLESSTTVNQDAGRLKWAWDVATHATRASKGQLTAYYTSTERVAMTWGADASGPLLGFGAVTTPIAIPVLPTGAARTTEDIIAHLQSLGLARQS